MIKILVTGDRDWKNRAIVHEVLEQHIIAAGDDVILIHGDADGADKISDWAARDLSAHYPVTIDPHPARWYRINPRTNESFFFKGAGPERNEEMIKVTPDFVIAFHNTLDESKGTRDCVIRAIRRKFPILLVAENENTSAANPRVFSSSLIEPGRFTSNGDRPEVILQQALTRLHPLTW